jgi:PBP1b-binding outer membrane lipoprotein LpoB
MTMANQFPKIASLLSLVALLMAGCASHHIRQSPLVSYYDSNNLPTRPYEKIKLLATHDYLRNRNDVVNKFTSKAERLNADAIIMYPVEEAVIGKSLYKAVAIKWK